MLKDCENKELNYCNGVLISFVALEFINNNKIVLIKRRFEKSVCPKSTLLMMKFNSTGQEKIYIVDV